MSELSGENEQRVLYSSTILFEKSPIEAMEALKIRRIQIKAINTELAEWFTSYGRLRLHYVEELKKLQKRGSQLFTDENPLLQNAKFDSLGLCTPMWSDTLKMVNDEIKLFDQSTRKMGKDMIAPLKLYSRQNDSNLVEMDELIEIASSIKLAEKKGSDATHYTNEWSRKAPYFFEIFENYDYNRLILLKDIFLKYQTDISDVLAEFKRDNETGLEHVLSFNVDDEIKRFSDAVISKNLEIENIKLSAVENSRTSTDGFTASAAAAVASTGGTSKRHSALLSPHRLHHKKSINESPEEPNSSSSSSRGGLFHNKHNNDSANQRQSSTSSSLFSSTKDDKKKDKGKMRSKFGSIFRGKKKSKENGFTPPVIPESDSASISTAGSSRTQSRTPQPQARTRPQSIAGNYQSQSSIRQNQYGTEQSNSEVSESLPATNISSSNSYSNGVQSEYAPDSRRGSEVAAPNYKSLEPHSRISEEQPQSEKPESSAKFEQVEQSQQLEQFGQSQQPQQSLYATMRPTKRSDSLSSGNIPGMVSSGSYDASTLTPPLSTIPAIDQSASQQREITNIPESAESYIPTPSASTMSSTAAAPPPPPSSRKHVLSELVSSPSVRHPHGSVPVPPQQRKSVLYDQQQPLQPANTGSVQPESTNSTLAKNTTGGGGLVGGQIMHPSLTTPGLNSSIVELFNATFKGGQVVRSNAIGEVAFSYIHDETTHRLPSKIDLQLLSKNGGVLPDFMVNSMFLQQTGSQPGLFIISDPSQISLRTVGGLKYMLNNPSPPIIVTPIWKHEEKQSTVIISIKPSPDLSEYLESDVMILSNVLVSVSIQNALVISAATKPSGSLNKEKGRVTWVMNNPIVFNAAKKEERLVARFMTTQMAVESETGVQVRFSITSEDGASRLGFLNTDIDIQAKGQDVVENPFGAEGGAINESEWKEVPTMKTIVAGSYSGHS